jgi:long-chain-alcohol oxidase
VFQALRKGALLFYYMLPGPSGRNPAWDKIGYDGPLGTLEGAPPKALSMLPIDGNTRLECDVVIVGSGAGGGAAAAVLAGAGLDVIVTESGDYYDDQDFDGSELGALTRFYMGAPQASHDQSVGLLAGSCLGGGTVVNYFTSFPTPDDVRAEWASYGVSAFTSDDYTLSLDAVCERLGVNQEHNEPSSREQKLQEGCVKLGWHVDAMPRGVRHCAQGRECGYCGLGCRVGAKQSVVKTWLADAHSAGARRIFSSQSRWVSYDPGAAGSRGRFMADADAGGYGGGRIALGSFHIMCSARMGGSPVNSVCDPTGQTWEVRDLYVFDGSSFPTASGVNPQISIQAIAHMGARGLAARLS